MTMRKELCLVVLVTLLLFIVLAVAERKRALVRQPYDYLFCVVRDACEASGVKAFAIRARRTTSMFWGCSEVRCSADHRDYDGLPFYRPLNPAGESAAETNGDVELKTQ